MDLFLLLFSGDRDVHTYEDDLCLRLLADGDLFLFLLPSDRDELLLLEDDLLLRLFDGGDFDLFLFLLS